jgi:hypothetical protein
MSTQLMKKITGRLTDAQGQNRTTLPFGVTVTFTRQLESNSPGGWIGSAVVDLKDGTFELLTAYDMPSSEHINYQVFIDKRHIQSGEVLATNFVADILLSDNAYSDMFIAEVTGYTVFKGKVTLGDEFIPAIPKTDGSVVASIEVLKYGGSEETTVTAPLDEQGNYEIRIANTDLRVPEVKCGNPRIKVSILSGATLLAHSAPVEVKDNCVHTTLHVSENFTPFFTELEYYVNTLSTLVSVSESSIRNIVTEGEDAELASLAAVTCLDETKLNCLVNAARISYQLNVDLAQVYGLIRTSCPTIYDMAPLDHDHIADVIASASAKHIVPAAEDFTEITEALYNQRGSIAGEERTNNDETLLAVFTKILGSETDALTFLALQAYYVDADPEAFWASVTQKLNETKKERLQKGMQLLAITGMQAEITEVLLNQSGSADVRTLTSKTEADWETIITNANAANGGKVCIPLAIKNQYPANEAKTVYANVLKDTVADLYATNVFAAYMIQDGTFANKLTNKDDVRTFFASYPEFDLRVDNVWELPGSDPAYKDRVRAGLMPVQNMMRLTGGEPDAVIAMIDAGFKSSSDISEMSEEDFIGKFGDSFKGGTEKAVSTYSRAIHTTRLNMEAKVAMSSSNYVSDMFPMLTPPEEGQPAALSLAVTPDMKTLFGNMELCSCTECTSMYSPGAYFTDLLNFMKKKLSPAPSFAFNELKRRRPDLMDVDLTCKNANTPLPYIDLVNELLEKVILKYKGASGIPSSFQTNGTAKELEAYPEHTYKSNGVYTPYSGYKDVYNTTLKEAVYPNNLPFDLPLEESRTYLKHLGVDRYNLMYQFRPQNYSNSQNEFNALAEWLKVPVQEAKIICGTHDLSGQLYRFYGLTNVTNWYDSLFNGINNEGLGTILHNCRITYKEMLQMLCCDYLNPEIDVAVTQPNNQNQIERHRKFEVVSIDPADAGTCDISKLKIQYSRLLNTLSPPPAAEVTDAKLFLLNKWHRFLRLQRATGWSFYQLDLILNSLNIKGDRAYDNAGAIIPDSNPILDDAAFRNVAKAHQLATVLNLPPERVCALWSTISNKRYINFDSDNQDLLPSVYDNLFRNKAVMNPPSDHFPENGTITGTYTDITPAVLAAFGLEEDELNDLLTYWSVNTVSLAALSPVYGSALLARGLNMPVASLIQLASLLAVPTWLTDPFPKISALEDFITSVNRLKNLAFSQDELVYLVRGEDPQSAFTKDEDVKSFFTTLRSDLKKIDPEVLAPDATSAEIAAAAALLAAKRLNVIDGHFAQAFSMDRDVAHQFLQMTLVPVANVQTLAAIALQHEPFILSDNELDPGNSVTGLNFSTLYTMYRRVDRASRIVNKLNISIEEFQAFYNNNFVLLTGVITSVLSFIDYAPNVIVQQFINLNEWIMVRDRFNAGKENFIRLLGDAGLNTSQAAWEQTVNQITTWDPGDISALISFLNINYANWDFAKSDVLLRFSDIMNTCSTLGFKPTKVHTLISDGLSMDESKDVRMAAKAKYSDEGWAKVAKPLQDVLRERQRQSLVSYIIGTPNVMITTSGLPPVPPATTPATILNSFRDEDELYEFLLIDVEMSACTKTSRIKQGISSIQLFMDRLILSLENKDGIFGNKINITSDKVAQWESWRKWYRVWEANRKIFLYPENWIEPDLRDDKTPFFKDLETQLLQDEVTDVTAEDAFMDYLEKVDEVARLEPVSAYRQVEAATPTDPAIDILHVFARTYTEPHRYYYRKLEDGEWKPWQKMNVDIKSDHIVPVVWNRKLYVFWMGFQRKSMGNDEKLTVKAQESTTSVKVWDQPSLFRSKSHTWGNMLVKNIGNQSITTDLNDNRYNQWDVTLSWTVFKENKWTPAEISKDVMNMAVNKLHISDQAEATYTASLQNAQKVFSFLTKNGEIKLDELFKNKLYLYIRPDDNEYGMLFNLLFPSAMNESAMGTHTFVWRDPAKSPYVLHDDFVPDNMTAPANTRFNKMKFEEDPTGDGKMKLDTLNITPGQNFGYYSYSSDLFYKDFQRPFRSYSDTILSNTPFGTFKLTAPSNTESIIRPTVYEGFKDRFFYEDDRNTYFVQKEQGTYEVQAQTYVKLTNKKYVVLKTVRDFATTNYDLHIEQKVSNAVVKSVYATGGLYRFHTFYHAQITQFTKELNRSGVPGLLKLANQYKEDDMNFSGNYQPNPTKVHSTYPDNKVQFGFDQAYGLYNWEIFFHAPMMIAQRLSDNQQFEEARKWYHYIFDPTSTVDIGGNLNGDKKRFWKFYPFYDKSQQAIQTLPQLLIEINNSSVEALKQVDKWEKNPFKPHVIARIRVLAYMKNVLMKYLDNLFAWADQLFSLDTIESINEATQLYILASHLLGKRPEEVPARASTGSKTFTELDPYLDALSNAMVQVESYFAPNSGPLPSSGGKDDHALSVPMFYFCLPKNDKLLKYWDTLADRLFKIRNCMNIDGTVRQLPLYEPPIDPALLVRAAAAGISAGSLLSSLSGNNRSHYRFSYVLQKANEFCNDVRSLGGSLLSAIEKKDAEQLALLRSGQELQLLEKVRTIKEMQIQEAEANLEAVRRTRETTQMRQQYYGSRAFMNAGESQHLESLQTGMVLQAIQGGMQAGASAVSMIPQFHAQATFAIGASFGGQQLSAMMSAISTSIGIAAGINNARGSMALTRAGYERRKDDWVFQASTAGKELEQLDNQILASEIRLDMAQRELANHELQMENSSETDAYMRSKFSNAELYNWMISQIQATYFQSYQLAYDMAKKAETCFDLELPGFKKPAAGFVGFAYWDSLRKGLMSGDKLQFDLRKMESAYMDGNKRELELTKNISLALTDPAALLNLRSSGTCAIFIPEELFDLDYPGHYLRRIKSVSISLPCITGPYTTVAATLTLKSSKLRKDALTNPVTDSTTLMPSIATSGGQNDSGVFELNFRDERYLPFEGRGAISEWELSLGDPTQIRQFDFETIGDVIMHVKYTALDSGASMLKTQRISNLHDLMTGTTINTDPGYGNLLLPRYYSLKHEFSQDWFAAFQPATNSKTFTIKLKRSQFPEYTRDKTITLKVAEFHLVTKSPIPALNDVTYKLTGSTEPLAKSTIKSQKINLSNLVMDPAEAEQEYSFTINKEQTVNGTTTALPVSEADIADLFLVFYYKMG